MILKRRTKHNANRKSHPFSWRYFFSLFNDDNDDDFAAANPKNYFDEDYQSVSQSIRFPHSLSYIHSHARIDWNNIISFTVIVREKKPPYAFGKKSRMCKSTQGSLIQRVHITGNIINLSNFRPY